MLAELTIILMKVQNNVPTLAVISPWITFYNLMNYEVYSHSLKFYEVVNIKWKLLPVCYDKFHDMGSFVDDSPYQQFTLNIVHNSKCHHVISYISKPELNVSNVHQIGQVVLLLGYFIHIATTNNSISKTSHTNVTQKSENLYVLPHRSAKQSIFTNGDI